MFMVIISTLAFGVFEPGMIRPKMGILSSWFGICAHFVGVGCLRHFWSNGRPTDAFRYASANTAANQSTTGQSCKVHSECYNGFYCDSNGGCSACDSSTLSIPNCILVTDMYPANDEHCATTEEFLIRHALARSNAGVVVSPCCNMQELAIYTHAEIGHPDWRPIDGVCCDYGPMPDFSLNLWFTAFGLGVIMNLMDPLEEILSPLRARSTEEIAQRTAQKHGLTEEQVLDAKITAVWDWIDYFNDGTIEPQEIYRMAQRIEDWLINDRPDGWDVDMSESDADYRPAEKVANYQALAAMLGVEVCDRQVYESLLGAKTHHGAQSLQRRLSSSAAGIGRWTGTPWISHWGACVIGGRAT